MRKAVIFFILLYLGYFMAKSIQKRWHKTPTAVSSSKQDSRTNKVTVKEDNFNVLLYSKANGWVHVDAIAAAKATFPTLAQKQGWSLTISDDTTLFSPEQLAAFDVVIWNNVTGQTLNDKQRTAFQSYIETGGGYVGIHGAGDDSHQWPWYDEKVIRTLFSHHPMQPQFQIGTLNKINDSIFSSTNAFPPEWQWEDEWYVFYKSPRENGSTVLYNLDENGLVMRGDQENKNWGMGEDHPIVWYHHQEEGKIFYTAMGHKGEYFQDSLYQKLLIEAIEWAGNKH